MTDIIITCQFCGKPVKQLHKKVTDDGDLKLLVNELHDCKREERKSQAVSHDSRLNELIMLRRTTKRLLTIFKAANNMFEAAKRAHAQIPYIPATDAMLLADALEAYGKAQAEMEHTP